MASYLRVFQNILCLRKTEASSREEIQKGRDSSVPEVIVCYSLGDSIAQIITNDHDSALVGSFRHDPRTVHCQLATAQQRCLAIVFEFW